MKFKIVILALVFCSLNVRTQNKPFVITEISDSSNVAYGDITNMKVLSVNEFKNQYGHEQVKINLEFSVALMSGYIVKGIDKYLTQSSEFNHMNSHSEIYYKILIAKNESNVPRAGGNFKTETYHTSFSYNCSHHEESATLNLVFALGKRRYRLSSWQQLDLYSYQSIKLFCQIGQKPKVEVGKVYGISGDKVLVYE